MSAISIRRARETDVAAIVAMLADDALGRAREDASLPLSQAYLDAFAAIDGDPNQFLAVMTDGDETIGTLQITFIAGLSLRGARRGQIEAVRVAEHRRPADHQQEPARGASLLRPAWLQGQPHRLQAGALAGRLFKHRALLYAAMQPSSPGIGETGIEGQ